MNDSNKKKDDKDLKALVIAWFQQAKGWFIKNPLLGGGSLLGVLVLFLLLGSLGGNPSSNSTPSSSVNPSTSNPSTSSSSSSSALTEVTLTFDTQGGTSLPTISGLPGTPITQNLTTTKAVHTFVKFSSSILGLDDLELDVFPQASLTVYAIWEVGQFSVEFLELTGTIKHYASSGLSTLYTTDDGKFFGQGFNANGVFGNGTTSSSFLTTPVELTSFLDLYEGETITQIRLESIYGNGTLAMLLTSESRLLVAGSNYILTDNSATQETNMTTYRDITSSLNLVGAESISELILGSQVHGVRTTTNRFIVWGANSPSRLFPQPNNIASHIPVGTPTDITATLNQSLEVGESIELFSLIREAGLFKTTSNRYFTWGNNSSFALLMFRNQHVQQALPTEITTSVLNLIGESEEIIKFVPHYDVFVMNFITSDNQVYNYGDYRNVFLPNTTDRPTYRGVDYFGDSTPFNITSKFTFEEGEYATHLFAKGFISNFNRYFYGPTTLRTLDMRPLLQENETIIASFETQYQPRLLTNLGRVFAEDNNSITNVTSTVLSEQSISVQSLPYDSDINYVPTRSGYTFVGWYTDKTLTTRFTGKVPSNNNLKLYGRFIPVLS